MQTDRFYFVPLQLLLSSCSSLSFYCLTDRTCRSRTEPFLGPFLIAREIKKILEIIIFKSLMQVQYEMKTSPEIYCKIKKQFKFGFVCFFRKSCFVVTIG